MTSIRDRIVRFDRVPAQSLIPHPANWRRHPDAQKSALRGALEDIGVADALIVRQLPDGALQLVDGHLRAEMLDQIVPVIVTDLDEAEAEKFLLMFDPIGALAARDDEAMRTLLDRVQTSNAEVQTFLEGLAAQLPPPAMERAPLEAVALPEGFVDIRSGHVLDVLRAMPADSVQCVVTSPPYWGLRDYGLPPQIWGGDSACDHVWGDELTKTVAVNDKREGMHTERDRMMDGQEVSQGAFCTRCQAWRGSLGLEPDFNAYIAHFVEVFREVRRVLRPDGTLWLNMGDSYAAGGTPGGYSPTQWRNTGSFGAMEHQPPQGLKPKDLLGQPWRTALALQADGWYLRSDIIWAKPNPMPESITDRPTKAHEYLFLLAKSDRYFYDAAAIEEDSVGVWNSAETLGQTHVQAKMREATPATRATVRYRGLNADGTPTQHADVDRMGRNKRTVWWIATHAYPEAHFATFPEALVEPCVLAGTSERGCCAVCGAPWEREVERSGGSIGEAWSPTKDPLRERYVLKAKVADGTYRRETIGWRPTCAHDAEARPCTVLDPFAGSGTTLFVAKRLGRSALGIELNPDYCALITRRLAELVES